MEESTIIEFVDNDEEQRKVSMPTLSERTIWKGYQWGAVILPIVIMLSHWYIFYVFSKNTQEVLKYPEANEICIAWIYSLLYLIIPLMLMPATYLFRWCNLFRVPFVYFIFINVERWYYGDWFCTNEMVDTHYVLIYCIMCIYLLELLGVGWRYRYVLPKKIKTWFSTITRKNRKVFKKTTEKDERYKEILSIIESKDHDEV